MICTSAFSAGNDYPAVRLVVHAGTPFEMVGFIQEVSRAGRGNRQNSSSHAIARHPLKSLIPMATKVARRCGACFLTAQSA
jgi:superfamily II DNA helicase RecQ